MKTFSDYINEKQNFIFDGKAGLTGKEYGLGEKSLLDLKKDDMVYFSAYDKDFNRIERSVYIVKSFNMDFHGENWHKVDLELIMRNGKEVKNGIKEEFGIDENSLSDDKRSQIYAGGWDDKDGNYFIMTTADLPEDEEIRRIKLQYKE